MPGGQPSKIDQVVGYTTITRADGTTEEAPVTAADRIVGSLKNGNYFEQSCAAAGVHRETAYGWLRTGAQAIARAASRGTTLDEAGVTDHELACVQFSDAVAEAEAEWEVRANTTLEQLARGGLRIQTVTEKHDANGNLVERTTKTERLQPSAQVIEWRLTRRYPDRYGQRVDVFARAADQSLPMEDRASAVAGEIRAYLQGRADEDAAREAASES